MSIAAFPNSLNSWESIIAPLHFKLHDDLINLINIGYRWILNDALRDNGDTGGMEAALYALAHASFLQRRSQCLFWIMGTETSRDKFYYIWFFFN